MKLGARPLEKKSSETPLGHRSSKRKLVPDLRAESTTALRNDWNTVETPPRRDLPTSYVDTLGRKSGNR